MPPSQERINELIQARNALYSKAFTDLSAEDVVSWQSQDLIYHDPAVGKYHMDRSASLASFKESFAAMSGLKVLEETTFGSLEFTTWEVFIELTYCVDEPELGLFKGKKDYIRGVAMLWWRWEGEDEAWDGDVSDTENGVRGYKIVREHDYMLSLKEGTEGPGVRMF